MNEFLNVWSLCGIFEWYNRMLQFNIIFYFVEAFHILINQFSLYSVATQNVFNINSVMVTYKIRSKFQMICVSPLNGRIH